MLFEITYYSLFENAVGIRENISVNQMAFVTRLIFPQTGKSIESIEWLENTFKP